MPSFPLMIDLRNKQVIIIGGGPIAERKIQPLLTSGAFLTVVSPEVTPVIEALALDKKITWRNKKADPEDVEKAFFVIAAADRETNEKISSAAPENCLINNTADGEKGNTAFPSHVRRGRLTIAVSTGGASPKAARKIKQELEKTYGEPYEQYMDFLYEVRLLLKASNLPESDKHWWLEEVTSPEYLSPEKQSDVLHRLEKLLS
ncbi:MAG: NAD(P)-binding protein [Alkalicoccus sp.]|nr:MAG: NAD(P)-binding protein [Alkalicoccus sp.]